MFSFTLTDLTVFKKHWNYRHVSFLEICWTKMLSKWTLSKCLSNMRKRHLNNVMCQTLAKLWWLVQLSLPSSAPCHEKSMQKSELVQHTLLIKEGHCSSFRVCHLVDCLEWRPECQGPQYCFPVGSSLSAISVLYLFLMKSAFINVPIFTLNQ